MFVFNVLKNSRAQLYKNHKFDNPILKNTSID